MKQESAESRVKQPKKLFDKNGRMIPVKGMFSDVCIPDRRRRLAQPKLDEADFAERILRLYGCLGIKPQITSKEMKNEVKRLLAIILMDSQIANIANGVCLPIVLPNFRDPGNSLDEELDFYYQGVGASYKHAFGDREFLNLCKGYRASVIDEKQGRFLLPKIREGRGPIVALYFPQALWGFSIRACRRHAEELPNGLILPGVGTIIAMIMYPDILADGQGPVITLSAIEWLFMYKFFFYFAATSKKLVFGATLAVDEAFPGHSNGLLFSSPANFF